MRRTVPPISPTSFMVAVALVVGVFSATPSSALAQGDEASLQRGAVEDMTPQQRYSTAIREAGGGMRVSLEECRAMATAERRACEAQARARYQADMAAAKEFLRNPNARPVNVIGGPIRSTESTYVVKP
ncbi:hypothetical protein [Acidovorax sp.]|uniref:hypothetical protein n=1 Tax=Acidovorax sp. TaxID=1872122 RepID=UPI002ACE19D1|nr:hypothetical protein [Acidovorax sp.]MDZ7863823.1 hypothetical protein [Acidovorax sp.]